MEERRAVASFDVTGWDQQPYDAGADEGTVLSEARVTKLFTGELEGQSTARLLMCQADPDELAAGAGYVASEIVEGRLEGREGSFVVHHMGLSEVDGARRTFGHVVPGSGTGELEGLMGEVEIRVDDDGGHIFTLDYRLA